MLDRVEQIERLRRPLHILEGRILNALCGCGALERFGYRAIGELAQDRMGICERTAHYRMNLADICGDAPLLERAILDGEIGETAARLLRSVRSSAVDLPAWIQRASRIPVSQLEDEIEIRRKMRLVDPLLVGIFHGPFPHPGLEKALHRLLARRGRPAPAVEAFLRKKGIPLTREGNWRDPAEQPSILRRLEAMLEILLEKEFDLLPDLDPAQTSARRRRVHVRFRAPNAVANDLEAALATLDERWKEANRPPAPRWLFFSLLMKHATEEWLRVDPSRVPERNEIYERDGYQCQAPHCRRRSRLHSHHIWPLGLGGPDTPWNQVTVCDAHHVLIHAGVVHVRGTAPDGLTWHMGCRPGRPSLELSLIHISEPTRQR
ncbi:MAG: HNH endonuclease signature motif containing protein, partial [Candidatus Eisenbacteria bacterium]|nr:HNH endonuclease signature motif containing protein [Candidatus Eisenbacteria bacterium]